ncbi:MAG: gliding motility-associated C-terminal domain-containing protein [Bacteroidia bacterium]|nr:gliding motility-associated C-terminal domain-containing protein [Bacteroidia bacterium]
MKRIIFLFSLIYFVQAQDYYMNVVNGQTITTCKGNVLPSWLCVGPGLYAGYCNNENYTVTFYSGNPSIPLRISFLPLNRAGFPTANTFWTENGFDYLRIYDGPNIASPLLASLTGSYSTYPLFFTSTGGYLTLRFTSDATINDWGWIAILGCQPQNCNGNIPASDNCSSSPGICDLNGYCGNTSGWYTADNINLGVDMGGPFCGSVGSIENNSWIKFIPNSSSASITFSVSACSSTASGIQAGLYSSANCAAFTQLTCFSQSTAPGPFSTFNLSYNFFTPGQTYYIMVDGYAGNACNYTVNANTGVAISTINATSGGTICQGATAILTATAPQSPASYTWSTGQTTQTISVSPTINTVYTATISSGFCVETVTRQIIVNPLPIANAGSAPTITCNNPNVTLNGSGGVTYTWTGPGIVSGSNSANPIVNQPGNYSLVVGSAAGCTSTNNAVVSVPANTTPPTPGISFSGSLTCANPNLVLSGSPAGGVNYQWHGPSGFNSTLQNPTVSLPGTYTLTTTNISNGCSASITTVVPQNTLVSFGSSTNGTITCVNNLATITANQSSYNYTWTPPTGASILLGQFTPTVEVSGQGIYTVVAQNPVNGCTLAQTVSLPINTVQPNGIIQNTPVLTCTNPTVTLNGAPTSGVTYTWSGPGIVGSPNNANVQINAPGVYSLAITSTNNGCTDPTPAFVNITQNISTPTISAVTQTANLVCGATSTILSGTANPAGSTYTWVSSGGTFLSGVNSSTVSVGTATTYTLLSTHPVSGCTSALVYTVIPDINTPTVNLTSSSGTLTCLQTAVSTTANTIPSTGVTFTWTGPGISGASNTSAVTATLAGTYNLTVTNTMNNCSSVVSFVVSANNTPLTPNAVSSNSINCNVTSATLSANPSPTAAVINYTWNGPGVSGVTSPTVAVSPTSTAVYTVQVQNPLNGCSGTQTVQVVANTNAPTGLNVSPNNVILACPSQTAILTATASGSGNSYNWTAPVGGNILSGSASNTVLVSSGSTVVFTVTVTGANGCTAATTATVSPNTNAPQFNFSTNNPSITCQTSNPTVSVNLTSTVGIQSYLWIPASGISGPNNLSFATFTQAGIYTVVVTATNGCITSSTLQVGTNTTSPQFTSGSGTAQPITCTQSTSIINPQYNTPVSELTFTWSGSGIVGSPNAPGITVNQAGIYTVQITNTLTGCSSGVLTVQVNGNNVPPTLTISTTSTLGITCLPGGNTVQLTANSSNTNLTYNWSNGSTGQQITVNMPGVYTVTITETSGNCSTTGTVSVAGATTAPTPSISPTGALPCGGGTTAINASGPSNYQYNWSGPGIVGSNTLSAITVSTGGTYSVQVTDSQNGCSANYTIGITQITVSAQFTADPITGSAPLPVTFSNQSSGATSFSWNFGGAGSSNMTNPNFTFDQPGNYTVTLTAQNGSCTAIYTLEIQVKDALMIPELVTPNGDMKNDVWFIKGLDAYPKNKVEIFNRWGNLVFKMEPYDNKWDGRPNVQAMGTDKLPTGTYFYILYLYDKDNTVKKGFLKLEY